MFKNIRIVMVNTSHPGNIGATARAMKNMGLTSLYLVEPKIFPSAEATARASGADDVLAQAVVCDSLDEALAECSLVVGASARLRSITWPQLDPRECAAKVVAECADGPVALVFGREHSGLTNAELSRCHYLVNIPTNPEYPSLNIAAAIQVIAYEVRMTQQKDGVVVAKRSDSDDVEFATMKEVEQFYAHLEEVMVESEFLDPAKPKFLMHRLRRLYNRARLEKQELNILRGILTAVQKWR
ncbi:tRNA (cytidine(32)/uridine(32)-2'-O)-methyltransferase [hydrothermal vent metagenome]|uniref:tRNA (Cytidine(32)/uridine(32)-2'-O)-methyltransferase n=1 Tax=hydrothermal vent metagenome TaxID=652676 RepID=A0A3B0Z9U5_9ZZZZ